MRGQRGRHLESRFRLSPKAWIAATVILACMLLVFVFVSRQVEIARRRGLMQVLEDELDLTVAEQERLRERLASADDPEAIELVARERLGLVRPGEEKIVFVEEP